MLTLDRSRGRAQGGDESDEDGEQDEDKYADEADMAGQKVDTAKRITVRNLRCVTAAVPVTRTMTHSVFLLPHSIREDTAKYLHNLDVDSSHYDPKSRSMRQNPNPDKDLSEVRMPRVHVTAIAFPFAFR